MSIDDTTAPPDGRPAADVLDDDPLSPGISVAPLNTQSEDALPEVLRLLCLCDEPPSWIGLSLELDRGGCHAPRFRHERSTAAALAALRDESFDAVLVVEANRATFDPRTTAEHLHALRTGLVDDPLVVVVPTADDGLAEVACREDADLVVTERPWSCPAIVPALRRALRRQEVVEDHRRLTTEHRRRLDRDRSEAERLLRQQQSIIAGLGRDGGDENEAAVTPQHDGARRADTNTVTPPIPLPREVATFYDDLLRTHVIMGSGRLSDEIAQLAEMLAAADIGPRTALGLHLERVASLVRGLGNRSTRHVVARADLLALELVVHLGECYRDAA